MGAVPERREIRSRPPVIVRVVLTYNTIILGKKESMEMTQERVLAYTMATQIDHDELDNVSGGGAHGKTKPSMLLTAGPFHCPDCVYD